MLHSNDELLNIIKNIIIDYINSGNISGYNITFMDIDNDKQNVIGLYLRTFGEPLVIRNVIKSTYYDLTLRIHGNLTDMKKLSDDVAYIANNMLVSNIRKDNINISGIKIRSIPEFLGKTSKDIPVFNIAFELIIN